MKYHILKSSALFVSGFCAGIILFYISFKKEIAESLKRREALARLKKTVTQDHNQCLNSNYSLPFYRFFSQLRHGHLTTEVHCEPDDIIETAIISKGESIRQFLDAEKTEPIPFTDLQFVRSLMENTYQKLAGTPGLNHTVSEVNLDHGNYLQLHTESEQSFLPSLNQSNLKSKSSSEEDNVHKYSPKKLSVPNAVFVTPYPLHMVYRKLKTSRHHHSDLGFCHPIIISTSQQFPRVASNVSFNVSLLSEDKYGTEMDWRCIGSSDNVTDPNLSRKLNEILIELICEFISEESWRECYYRAPKTSTKILPYVSDLPEFKLFILPLFFNTNSKISKLLTEYHTIVQKSSMLGPINT